MTKEEKEIAGSILISGLCEKARSLGFKMITGNISKRFGLLERLYKIGFETNLIPLIQAIVRQGFGISALLNRAIEGVDEIVGIPFEQPVLLDLAIAWRKEGYLSKANQAFLDFLLANTASDDN